MGKRVVRVAGVAVSLACFAFSGVALSMPNYARQSNVSCSTCHSQKSIGLGVSADSDNSTTVLDVSSEKGINAGLKVHTAGSSAANGPASGFGAKPVTELYLTKDNNYDLGLNGLTGYLNTEDFYAGVSLFSLDQTGTDPDGNSPPLSLWYRFGVTPKVGGIDLALGLFGEVVSSDNTPSLATNGTDQGTDTIGLDAKVKGQIGSVTLNLKAMYLNSISSYVSGATLQTGRSRGDLYAKELSEGFGAAARLNIRKAFGLSAAYRTYKSKGAENPAKTNLATVGAWVNLPYDITLESQYTTAGEDSELLTEDSAFTLLFITSF